MGIQLARDTSTSLNSKDNAGGFCASHVSVTVAKYLKKAI